MNSSKNYRYKSYRITTHTLITPSSYIITCQEMADNVPSLILKQLQAVPEIVLCPILWRLSILEKRHRPLTTQAIKNPHPPFIIISANTLLHSHCALLPARKHSPLKSTTCSMFPPPVILQQQSFSKCTPETLRESPKTHFIAANLMTIKKEFLPTVPEEISSMFTVAHRIHRCALTYEQKLVIPSKRLVAGEAVSYSLSVHDMKKNC